MKQTSTSKKHLLALSATLALAFAAGLSSAQAQTIFTGAVNSDPTNPGNYNNNTAPNIGGTETNGSDFSIQNVNGSPFIYTSADGTTAFNSYTYTAGVNSNNGLGTLDITGGSLSFGNVFANGGTVSVLADALVNVSGGTLSFLNGSNGDGNSLWIGNSTGNGTINITGGTLVSQHGTIFGRDGSTGTINLSGGKFEETASDSLTFTSGNINFTSGSTGVLSLFGASTSYLDGLVNSGDIFVNGLADLNTSDFAIVGSTTGQGTLALAAAAPTPEPSTWALLLGGLGMLFAIQRKRFVRS